MLTPTNLRHQFFVFAAPLMLALVSFLSLVYFIQRSALYDSEGQKNQLIVNTTTKLIASQFKEAFDDLDLIASHTSLTNEQNHTEIEKEIFINSLFETKPRYSRLLILDKKGTITQYYGDKIDLETTTMNLPNLNYGIMPVFENNLDQISISGIQIIKRQYLKSDASIIGFLILKIDLEQLENRLTASGIFDQSSLYLGFDHQFSPIFMNDLPKTETTLEAAIDTNPIKQELITTIQPLSEHFNIDQVSWIKQWDVLAISSQSALKSGKNNIITVLSILGVLASIIISGISLWLAKLRILRYLTLHDLAESDRLNKSIVETTTNAIVTINDAGKIISSNPAAQHLVSRAAKNIHGSRFCNLFIISKDHNEFLEFLKHTLAMPVGSHTELRDFTGFNVSGDQLPISIALSVDELQGQKIINIFITDNTEHEKNIELQRLTEVVFKAANEGISITDANNNIEAINTAFTRITGYSEEDVIGKNPRILRSGKHNIDFFEKLWQELHLNGIWKGEIWNRSKTGDPYLEEISIALVRNNDGQVIHHISIFHDISERKVREERIAYQAHYDQLTGLPNRFVFIDSLDREIKSFNRYGNSFALLFIDLDHFKEINDQYGHRVGDLVLQEAARRLTTSVRDSDMVARLAGDEFTLIIRALSTDDELSHLIEKIKVALNGTVKIGSQTINIQGSVGGVIYSEQHGNADDVLQLADESMYQEKRKTFI